MLTNREVIVLRYLSQLMEANAKMIGEEVLTYKLKGGSNYSAVGGAICGRLRKRGLVTFLPDLNAWRITRAGREAIAL